MRIILLSFLFLPLLVQAQEEMNKVITDSTLQEEVLYGYCTVEGLRHFHAFMPFFNEGFELYQPEPAQVESFRDQLAAYDITIVLGTWCSDSQTQVPRFIRILMDAGYDMERLTIISTDRKKQAEGTTIEELDISLVPTFIFYMDGAEAGRIIESPDTSLEDDILRILSGSDE